MIFILLLSLFYICLTVASSQLLLSLSVPVLLLLTLFATAHRQFNLYGITKR